jgi:manganese transport protein
MRSRTKVINHRNGREAPSLVEVYRSVRLPEGARGIRRFLAFAGPGFLVSVGYMDPGNWSSDLSGGSIFGYKLLWVILASNLMAQLLQVLCARFGLVTGRDLAQACRDYYKRPVSIALWLICEIAIVACDFAEVIGSAVALNLLLGIPLVMGVFITSADVLILLALMRFGFRLIEAIVITLVTTIGVCFAIELIMAKPDLAAIGVGMIKPAIPNFQALYISLSILGATVMPHNLYLHSSIVQTRATEPTEDGLREAIKNNTWDTILALSAAFFVNAAILVLAAAVFHGTVGKVEELQDAHRLLTPLLGGGASTLFAVALLASGQSSTITGTLAGQIVMEGFLRIRITPWLRRLITRLLAIIPAAILIAVSGGKNTVDLLNLSQVVLSMQLSFATFPLVMFTSDKKRMGKYVNPLWLKVVGYAVCTIIAGLNIYLLYKSISPLLLWGIASVTVGFAVWVMVFYKGKEREAKM